MVNATNMTASLANAQRGSNKRTAFSHCFACDEQGSRIAHHVIFARECRVVEFVSTDGNRWRARYPDNPVMVIPPNLLKVIFEYDFKDEVAAGLSTILQSVPKLDISTIEDPGAPNTLVLGACATSQFVAPLIKILSMTKDERDEAASYLMQGGLPSYVRVEPTLAAIRDILTHDTLYRQLCEDNVGKVLNNLTSETRRYAYWLLDQFLTDNDSDPVIPKLPTGSDHIWRQLTSQMLIWDELKDVSLRLADECVQALDSATVATSNSLGRVRL